MKRAYAYAHYREEPQPELVPSDDISVGDCVEIHLPDGDTLRAVVESWNCQGIRCHQCCLDAWFRANRIDSRIICPRDHRMFPACGFMYIFKDIDKMLEEI